MDSSIISNFLNKINIEFEIYSNDDFSEKQFSQITYRLLIDECACKIINYVDNYLYFSKGFISSFRGIGKLNLDTYEFTELDCSALLDNDICYLGSPDFSSDGTTAAVYGIVSQPSEINGLNEYQAAIYSLTDKKVITTYNFFSEHDYVDHQLIYHDDGEVYLYLSQYGDNPQHHLYIIDVTT